MATGETERAIRCANLSEDLRSAIIAAQTESHRLDRTRQKLRMEENQLASLKTQAARTGDKEGFAPQIQAAEAEVRRTSDELRKAEQDARFAKDKENTLFSEFSRIGCSGTMGIPVR